MNPSPNTDGLNRLTGKAERIVQLGRHALEASHAALGFRHIDCDTLEVIESMHPDRAPEEQLHSEEVGEILSWIIGQPNEFHIILPGTGCDCPHQERFSAIVGVPILQGGQRAGAIFFGRSPGEEAFTPHSESLVNSLRQLLEAYDLSNEARLIDQTRLMRGIVSSAHLGDDLPKILETPLHEIARRLPMSCCAVWILDDPEAQLEFIYGTEPPNGETHPEEWRPGYRITISGSCFEPVVSEAKPLMIHIQERFPDCHPHWNSYSPKYSLAFPLMSSGAAVGVLEVLSARRAGFTSSQIDTIRMAAELLSPTVGNARLFAHLNHSYTQLREIQLQLVQSEKMRAVGELASGMAHDFNNSLCSILGFVDLAILNSSTPPVVRDQLKFAKTATEDAAATVRRVQDFARWDSDLSDGQPIDPNQMIVDVGALTRPKWQDLATSKGLTVELETRPESSAYVFGVASEIREVLTNLVFNAVDAMPEGGRITLTSNSSGGEVYLSVSDTGHGIPEEDRQRIFEPFYTTKKKRGTGMGLSVSYSIIHRHGGEISVTSTVGSGTTFLITLPARDKDNASVSPLENGHPKSGKNVLVVDDERELLAIMDQMLKYKGHQPLLAHSGTEALRIACEQPFDLLITDYKMKGMNGMELALAFHDLYPNTPIILLSAWADQLHANGKPLPAIDMLVSKPVTVEQLDQAVHQVASSQGS